LQVAKRFARTPRNNWVIYPSPEYERPTRYLQKNAIVFVVLGLNGLEWRDFLAIPLFNQKANEQ